ncbi:hypothetical protein EDD37DRAFT_179438 [Exophiala viscosa]|uniref:uncharacterized protein n=1 Tax=Exophiala viscosa TaxID=2486360 RepID=UPI002193F7BD|nr:hypothetical protein EDD37DRAFT_179438 [Exophiala viscosa]
MPPKQRTLPLLQPGSSHERDAKQEHEAFDPKGKRKTASESESEASAAHAVPTNAALTCKALLGDKVWNIVSAQEAELDLDAVVLRDHPELFGIEEYLYLLVAMRCSMDGELRLQRACSWLYAHVRHYRVVGESEYAEFLDNLDDEDYDNPLEPALEELTRHLQLAGTRQPTKAAISDEQYATASLAFSLGTEYPSPSRPRKSDPSPSLAGVEDTLQQGYYIRDSKFFSLGRVFITLWHENATHGNRYLRNVGTTSAGVHGEKIFSHIRRFAVVRIGRGFCWAVPVNTYRGQGLTRPSFKNKEEEIRAHAIIHIEGTGAEMLEGEPKMIKRPIVVENAGEDKRLDRASRIRFDKVFTIEHNVRVKNVGKITQGSMPYFRRYWQDQANASIDAMKAR